MAEQSKQRTERIRALETELRLLWRSLDEQRDTERIESIESEIASIEPASIEDALIQIEVLETLIGVEKEAKTKLVRSISRMVYCDESGILAAKLAAMI